ncbi:MAG: hypothetical protein ACPG7F_01170 [Aggregatilineales bacterium]
MSTNKVFGAGTQWAFFGFVQSNYNLLLGNNTTALSNGETRPMFHITGIREANTGFAEGEAVSSDGDDGSVGSIDFENPAPRDFIVEAAIDNMAMEALMQGSSVWDTGNIRWGVVDPKGGNYPDGCLILQSKAKSKDVISSGSKRWSGLLYPRVTAQPLGEATRTSRTAWYQRFKLTAQLPVHHPVGITIADVTTLTGYALKFHSHYPVAMQTFKKASSGSEDFVLPYTPVSASTDDNILYLNRVRKTSGYGVTPATKTLAVSDGDAGDQGIMFYHFQPSGV